MSQNTLLYHASPTPGIRTLEPRISNHGLPRVYFSRKRENTLVYLCNAVEKHCRETGFCYSGPCEKWGPYGFTPEGLLRLEEYYPNALEDTYKGISAYIYMVHETPAMQPLEGIQDAVISAEPVPVAGVERIEDAYQAILAAQKAGQIEILRYEQLSKEFRAWNERTIREEYASAEAHPEYRHFIKAKFNWLSF